MTAVCRCLWTCLSLVISQTATAIMTKAGTMSHSSGSPNNGMEAAAPMNGPIAKRAAVLDEPILLSARMKSTSEAP